MPEFCGFSLSRSNEVRERCPHEKSYGTEVKSLILLSGMEDFELRIIQDRHGHEHDFFPIKILKTGAEYDFGCINCIPLYDLQS